MSLTAEGVHAGYAGRPPVLGGVDVAVAQGTVAALIGPNGSGKSTLLRCLAGVLRPGAGRVLADGEPLSGIPARSLARRLAYVPQETPVPFAFTVEEIVRLAPGAAPGSARFEAAVDAMELAPLLHRPLTALSGGERQRAAIARGLAQDAPYLLLDEPTAHLDLRHQVRLFQAIRARAAAAGGVLVVLHDLEQAARWADVVVLLDAGRVAASGAPRDTLTPERLSAVYRTRVLVGEGPEGALTFSAAPATVPAGPPI